MAQSSRTATWHAPGWPTSDETLPLAGRLRRQRQDRTEAQIQQQARSRLESSGYAAVRLLHCRIADGTLVIQGEVHSYYLKQVAQELVQRLDLTQPIVNEVTVTYHDSH